MRRCDRVRGALLIVCLAASPAAATTDFWSTETLVGWSEDGVYHAVIRSEYTYEIELVVYKGKTVVKTFPFEDPRVPGAGLTRIDVATWAPLVPYKLMPVSAANRARFAAQLELIATSAEIPGDQHHACTGGGWSLRRAGKVVRQVWLPGKCVTANGGYLSPDGKHALVKITAGAWTSDQEAGAGYDTLTSFVAIDLP